MITLNVNNTQDQKVIQQLCKERDSIIEQGKQAYSDGLTLSHNPFSHKHHNFQFWNRGFTLQQNKVDDTIPKEPKPQPENIDIQDFNAFIKRRNFLRLKKQEELKNIRKGQQPKSLPPSM